MNLHFFTVGEITDKGETYLIQKANVTNDRSFWINWNAAKREDTEARRLCRIGEDVELPYNIRRFLTLTTKKIDGEIHSFAVRKILKSTQFDDYHKLYPIHTDYLPRDESQLLPFQIRSFEHLCNVLSNVHTALDASDTGLGKTYVSAAICREFYLRPIVICKKIAIGNWLDILQYFNVSPYGVINWEYMIRGNTVFYKDGKWNIPHRSLLIFDEAHSANHEGSKNNKMYESSAGLPSLSLTATIGDKPIRLAPFFHVLGAMDKQTFTDWRKCRGEFQNRYNEYEMVSESDDMRALHNILFPRYGFRLRYTDPDVKKAFPTAIYNTTLITIGKEAEDIQNEAYEKLLEKIEIMKKEKSTSDFEAAKMVEELRFRQLAEMLKVSSFSELAKDYINKGFSVIIFLNYRESLFQLAKKLKTDSVIMGEQDKQFKPRNEVIEDFQSDKSRIILAMIQAAGQSISLHDITGKHQRISFISPCYNPIDLKQTLGRTNRANSKTPPIMSMVFAAKTIEEKVAHAVNRKLDNISAINDGDLALTDTFSLNGE